MVFYNFLLIFIHKNISKLDPRPRSLQTGAINVVALGEMLAETLRSFS
jgi:hypothetical protein